MRSPESGSIVEVWDKREYAEKIKKGFARITKSEYTEMFTKVERAVAENKGISLRQERKELREQPLPDYLFRQMAFKKMRG